MKAPAWARLLLGWIVPEDRREDVLGDLEEAHGRRRERLGGVRAWLASSLDACRVAVAFVLYRWREGESRLPWITGSDLRLSLRLMRKQPILAATAVLALAVGITLAMVGYSMLDASLHGELPFEGGERFVTLRVLRMPEGHRTSLDLERYHLFRESTTTLEHLGALGIGQVNLAQPSGRIEPVQGAFMTPESFRFLSVTPRLGRTLIPADGAPGAPPVAVVGESLWRNVLGGGTDVVGRRIRLGAIERIVVGVMPESFEFPTRSDVWLPLDERFLGGDASGARAGVGIFGILRPEVSREVAEEELVTLSRRWRAERPSEVETRLTVHSFTEPPNGLGLFGTVMVTVLVLVLLVIAGNVANLILARTSSRIGELAVRSALGASRPRLIGQLTAEVLLLGTVAAGLGLLAAQWILAQLDVLIDEKPSWIVFSASPRTMVFVVGITLAACAVGGVLPALRATRRDPAAEIRRRGRADSGFAMGRLGKAMMIGELALSVALLSGALVAARGFVVYLEGGQELPRGSVLTARIVTVGVPERSSTTGIAGTTDWPAAVTRTIQALPGVTAAGVTSRLPRQDPPTQQVFLAAETDERERELPPLPIAYVQPGYLEALDARVVAGRLFTERDFGDLALPVAVVNEPFVASVLGGRNPVGRRIRTVAPGEGGQEAIWREIVGVVPDLGFSAADPDRAAGIYLPLTQEPRFFYLALRTAGDPTRLTEPLHKAIAELDPDLAVHDVQLLDRVNWEERAFLGGLGTALCTMGATALLLSLAGIYAILSFTVTRRSREIGVRVALGASRRQILRMVTGSAGKHLVLGALLGTVMAFGFLRAQDAMLVTRLPTGEPWVLPAVVVSLAVAGVLACLIPARRALDIEPSEALRME